MKPLKLLLLASFTPWLVSLAQAHPGHDGDELIWEYSGEHIHLDGFIWVTLAALTITVAYRLAKKRA